MSKPHDAPIEAFLTARRVPFEGEHIWCDHDLLAAAAEGRLDAREAAGLRQHLLMCPTCREVLGFLAAGGKATAPRLARPTAVRLLAAACLLLALGLGAFLLLGRGEAPGGGSDLAAAFEALERTHADLIAGLAPLDDAELAREAAPVLRGGLVVLEPQGTVLEARPTLRWRAVPGIDAWSVEVLDEEGRGILRAAATGSDLPWPELMDPVEPGATGVVKVTGTGPAGPVEGRRAFTVADAMLATRYDAIRRAVEARVPEAQRDLLLAHLAFRLDLRVEALRRAEAAARATTDPLAARTLRFLRGRLGYEPP